MKIKVTKLEELPDALNPNNIVVGFIRIFSITEEMFMEPEVGKRFYPGGYQGDCWSTSGVCEIIDKNTFRTYSSIYKWEIEDED